MMSEQKDFREEQTIQAFQTVGKVLFGALGRLALNYLDSTDQIVTVLTQDDALLTFAEACEKLKCGETKFRALCEEVDFGRRLVGGRPKFSAKKIESYIKKQKG